MSHIVSSLHFLDVIYFHLSTVYAQLIILILILNCIIKIIQYSFREL